MKTLITSFAFFCMIQLINAQTTCTWSGGTPGKPSDWTIASNWKEGRIPDENAQVIISDDRQYYPVITTSVEDIDALMISGGAALTILNEGSLSIQGNTGRLDVLLLLGKLTNDGTLRVENITADSLTLKNHIHGHGSEHLDFLIELMDVAQR